VKKPSSSAPHGVQAGPSRPRTVDERPTPLPDPPASGPDSSSSSDGQNPSTASTVEDVDTAPTPRRSPRFAAAELPAPTNLSPPSPIESSSQSDSSYKESISGSSDDGDGTVTITYGRPHETSDYKRALPPVHRAPRVGASGDTTVAMTPSSSLPIQARACRSGSGISSNSDGCDVMTARTGSLQLRDVDLLPDSPHLRHSPRITAAHAANDVLISVQPPTPSPRSKGKRTRALENEDAGEAWLNKRSKDTAPAVDPAQPGLESTRRRSKSPLSQSFSPVDSELQLASSPMDRVETCSEGEPGQDHIVDHVEQGDTGGGVVRRRVSPNHLRCALHSNLPLPVHVAESDKAGTTRCDRTGADHACIASIFLF
jgi:hypothetical protein